MREREGPAAAKSGSLHHPVRSSPPSPKFHLNKGRYGHIRDAEYNSRIYLYLWRSSLQVVFRWCPLLVPWCGRDLVRGPLSGWVWTRRSADPGRVVTSNVQEKVNQAEHCGEAIDNNVLDWLQDTDKASQGVDTFMDEKVVKENMWFCNFLGPDFIWCYRLSKQAEKKAVSIKQLAKKGSEIGTVSHPREDPLELELPSSKDYEDFNSRQKVFKGIVEALKDSNVNMIGVYGTGGVGKTTMVAKVVKLLKEDKTFDEVVMAVVSKDANVREIQGQLADRLNLTLIGETEAGRAKQLWKRLDNGKKNLIILDDVWHELDMKEIGIPITDGKKNCKVVLTSRNQDVGKKMDVHKDFTIKILSHEEAWALFKKVVENNVDSHDQRLRDIAWDICKECQGLPVVIKALGATLKGKEMYAWEDALDKLKNCLLKDVEGIEPKVYASLKWSYDWLDSEDAKSCFLLCCLFPEDYKISIHALVTWRGGPYVAIKHQTHWKKPYLEYVQWSVPSKVVVCY